MSGRDELAELREALGDEPSAALNKLDGPSLKSLAAAVEAERRRRRSEFEAETAAAFGRLPWPLRKLAERIAR